ncbi:hypothetical protein E2C01_052189 [Portunus trituberculatus]|uniref:Uncharacterized protein n=1 Tax=Portunus trituberculatus TaxID=210409 RepID=A0A5B7GNQ7_PORTR|nr:hypothetical protein [Portunus trituberculatus]
MKIKSRKEWCCVVWVVGVRIAPSVPSGGGTGRRAGYGGLCAAPHAPRGRRWECRCGNPSWESPAQPALCGNPVVAGGGREVVLGASVVAEQVFWTRFRQVPLSSSVFRRLLTSLCRLVTGFKELEVLAQRSRGVAAMRRVAGLGPLTTTG